MAAPLSGRAPRSGRRRRRKP